MRAGYNPVRRSRNIGLARQGHGDDNCLAIPAASLDDRAWYEDLHPYAQIHRWVRGRELVFLVENLFEGCVHACSVGDICRILEHLPPEDWGGLQTFVLRQPTRKQRLLRPVWGRLLYDARLGLPGGPAAYFGPTLMLEAIELGAVVRWSTSLTPDDLAELERLRADGHAITRRGRTHLLSPCARSARATQLYRTLLHEIGHWVDYQEKVVRPSQGGGDAAELARIYFARPKTEREAFAHRYAAEAHARLERFGVVPFDPIKAP